MTAQGPGRLCIVFTKVDSENNQEILEHFMINFSAKLWEHDFVFQQDSSHTLTRQLNDIKRRK